MHFHETIIVFGFIPFFICLSSAFKEFIEDEHKDDETAPLFFGHRPRIISIFSKPPEPDAPKQTGPNILGHVANVVHGGSIGIELKPSPVIHGIRGIIGHAKKKILGPSKPSIGHPENQKPPPEPYDPPKGGHWEEEEEEKDWVPENPKKPIPEGPSWEDIGEDPEDDPSIPYEDIINPRVKPRRAKRAYLNSKIYHVPLIFRSNGKIMSMNFLNMQKYHAVAKSMNGLHRK